MNQDLMVALITAAVPFVVSLAGAFYQWLAAKLPAKRLDHLANSADIVVRAVEQSAASLSGDQKKALALGLLRQLGVRVTPAVAGTYIEAAVHALHTESPPPPPAGL